MNCKMVVNWKDRILVGCGKGTIRMYDQNRLGHIQTFGCKSNRPIRTMINGGEYVMIEDEDGNLEKMGE